MPWPWMSPSFEDPKFGLHFFKQIIQLDESTKCFWLPFKIPFNIKVTDNRYKEMKRVIKEWF